MKNKIKKMLDIKEQRRNKIADIARTTEDIVELRSINTEIESLNGEIAELRSMYDALPEEEILPPEARATGIIGNNGLQLNPIATFGVGSPEQRNAEEDIYATVEYRNAFMNYIIKGTPIPDKFVQQRSDALTTVGDVGAVIPTTIQNKVIEDITVEGKILARITQTAFQGGIQIPISDINISATWLASENVTSDEQKAEMKATLSFSYHVLEAKVAIGLLTSTVTLPIFEATVTKQLKKAMIKAIEAAIIAGTGVGQPLGLTKYTLPTAQVVTMTSATIGKVATWAGVEAAVPESSEDSVIYLLNKATWEKYLNGMTDTAGQKIGLGKINEKGQKIINGREVLTTDKLPAFDNAAEGDTFGVVVDLSKYCLNSNLAMYYKKYFNEDLNKWIHKALMIADGKMAIGSITEGAETKLVGAKDLIYLKK